MVTMNYRTQPLLDNKAESEELRTSTFGPKPINIFTELRNKLGLSHQQLATRLRLSKQALIRLEQGTFNQPLPTVVDYYVKSHGYNELELTDAYEGYRQSMRKRHRILFGYQLQVITEVSEHPFRQLRFKANLNPSEVAKSLCIPQATIQHFERKWKQQKTVPKDLQQAMHDIGYTHNQIAAFCNDYHYWREQMIRRINDGSN